MDDRRYTDSPNLDADLVVVGGGGAGLAAAVAAAQQGVSVTVLERRRSIGGNSAKALGIFAAESPVQRRLRIDTSTDLCFQLAMDYAHNKINPRLFRAFVNKSGDTIRWLEKQGLRFFDVPPFFPGQIIRTWHCPKGGGPAFINVISRSCQNLGVKIATQTRARSILTDNEGNPAGVVATRKREKLEIAAKGIIIASGGYAGNKKLLEKYSITVVASEPVNERECYVLELNAIEKDVTYAKRKLWVDKERFVVLKTQLFALSGKLLKESVMEKVEKYEERYFATKLTMTNKLIKDRSTTFEMEEIDLNVDLPDDIFTKRSLER